MKQSLTSLNLQHAVTQTMSSLSNTEATSAQSMKTQLPPQLVVCRLLEYHETS